MSTVLNTAISARYRRSGGKGEHATWEQCKWEPVRDGKSILIVAEDDAMNECKECTKDIKYGFRMMDPKNGEVLLGGCCAIRCGLSEDEHDKLEKGHRFSTTQEKWKEESPNCFTRRTNKLKVTVFKILPNSDWEYMVSRGSLCLKSGEGFETFQTAALVAFNEANP